VRRAADGSGRAIIIAEPGLDAEAVARAIHRHGSPDGAPFVVVDCAQAAPSSVEGSLFGRKTGQRTRPSEVLERVSPDCALRAATGGTLFLANVTDMPASTQARLARVVRDGEVRLAGAAQIVPVGARLVAACGPTIDTEVAQGGFRADLYRRLTAVRVDVPAVRARPEDVPVIARHMMDALAVARGGTARAFTKAAVALLSALPWPGNLRELGDVLARVAAAAPPGAIRVEDVLAQAGSEWRGTPPLGGSLREAKRQFEREYIAAVLRQHGWRMGEAARALGIQRTNLYRKARQLSIPRVKVTR
jgi:DNA-binding NtrC family response regulator